MNSVRFAPSPTGHLHIGGVRTALFNYLYAKNQGALFLLRIEDTDVERSSQEMAEEILQSLRWLGMDWDGEPVYQSHRFEEYKKIAYRLVDEKKAYRCFCTPTELEARRQKDDTTIYKYDRKCLDLTNAEIEANLAQSRPFVVRFLIPEGETFFKDRVHKEMKIQNREIDDYVLLKSDGSPTYHLSVVADDSSMEITHVIRGDDHITNTYKQVLLYRALGLKPPKYAHLPLILGPDKKKLSKRHGETSVLEFKNQGYLPEALLTYLSQLSWLSGDDKKIYSMTELSKGFSLGKLSKNSPVFDYDKLRFLNARAIQEKDPRKILDILCEDRQFADTYSQFPQPKKIDLVELVKPRMKTLSEFKEKFTTYLKGDITYKKEDIDKVTDSRGDLVTSDLQSFIEELQKIDSFQHDKIEETLRGCADRLGIKAAGLIHPCRLALTGETVSPSIFEVFEFFGQAEAVRRINDFIKSLSRDVISH